MIIGSAAHFVVCPCRRHGRLVAASGKKTFELCSKQRARRALDLGVEKGFITEVEIQEALRQIDASPLPERDGDVELVDRLRARLNDWLKEVIDKEEDEFERFHHFHGSGQVH